MIRRPLAFSPALRPLRLRPGLARPFPPPVMPARVYARAWESTMTGDEKTGHIAASSNESIVFFDNLFPLRLGFFLQWAFRGDDDVAHLLKRFENSSGGFADPVKLVKQALPSSLPVKVTEIVPRVKDGGAFVKFSHEAAIEPAEIEGTVIKSLKENPIRPWFSPFRGISAGLVKGVPWLEDLSRYPKNRVRVEFVVKEAGIGEPIELSQETLFSLFRRYGKIAEITSMPSDSKVLPKYAYVDFSSMRDAIMARNCLHGFVVDEATGGGKNGTRLRLSYEQKVKAHTIWNWITNHPRLVIPLVAALLAAFTVVVFDPIREFFIKVHIQHSFSLSNYRIYRWFRRQTTDFLNFARRKHENAGLDAVWSHRRDLIDQIQTWLLESNDTFVVVQGPRGSGKKELVLEQSLAGRRNVLVIDCKPIVEARGEAGTIKALAASVGYRPVFSWANSISSLVDLAIQSTTGVKAGFSETLESQLTKILQTSASALKKVSLADRDKHDKTGASKNEDAYLEAHPERRAVIVIDNFLHKNDESSIVYDKLADWAAALVQNNIAHVIFLTDDTAYSKSLARVMPDRVFRQLALGDLSPEVAKKFIVSRLAEEDHVAAAERDDGSDDKEKEGAEAMQAVTTRPDLAELDTCIDLLGGRLTDLEFLARRLKGGQSPKRAVEEIIEQSATEIIKIFLLVGSSPTQPSSSSSSSTSASAGDKRRWSPEQAWYLVKALSERDALRYNEVLLSNTFASSTSPQSGDGEAALEALAAAELITVQPGPQGRPRAIRPGKPLYQAAFARLVADPVLRARMDVAVLTELAKVEAKSIDKVEAELALLAGLPRQPAQTAARVEYLLEKLEGSQAKIRGFEAEMGRLKKVLATEF